MQWTKVRKYLPIIGIILLSALFRFVYLDRVPTAISGDELIYAVTAKSIFLTGHDITGTWNPLSAFLFRYPPGERQAELPYFIHLFFSAPFPFSLFLSKLPFALMSVGIVLILYAITNKLFGKTVAIAAGLAAAINPWLVVMGRTGYESTPATFFYLLGLWILLSANSWGILWSFAPFILAFYSYIGTKLIFIPFVPLTIILAYRKQKRLWNPYTILALSSVLWTVVYLLLLKLSPSGSRISELLLPSSAAVAGTVNEIRKTAIQSPFLPLFVNKYAVYLQIISSKLFRIFSPTYLFMEGDQFFLPVRQSFFYYIDFLFMLWGALALFGKNRKSFFILTGFIFIGTLPHLLHKTIGDFSGHLALMFPFIIILVGAGIADCISHARGRMRTFAVGFVGVLYILNVASFTLIYFSQYPLAGAGDFPMRILTQYMTLTRKHKESVTVYSTRGGDLFKKYIFYSNSLSARSISEMSHIQTNQPFNFNGIHFTDCNTSITRTNAPSGVFIYDQGCAMHVEGSALKISSLLDGGQQYRIFNDSVCGKYELNTYPIGLTINDFTVENLQTSDFCKRYISR